MFDGGSVIEDYEVIPDHGFHEPRTGREERCDLDNCLNPCRFYAAGDSWGIGKSPMYFFRLGDPNSVYTVSDYLAAAHVTRELPRYVLPPITVLTHNRVVAQISEHHTPEERALIWSAAGSSGVSIDIRRAVDARIITRQNIPDNLGRAERRRTVFFPHTVELITQRWLRNEQGKYTLENTPGYVAAGYNRIKLNKPRSIETIAGMLYQYYNNISQSIARPLIHATYRPNYAASDLVLREEKEHLQEFTIGILKAVIAATTGGYYATNEENRSSIHDFYSAVMYAEIPSRNERPPREVIDGLLRFTSVLWTPTAIHRGFSVALPIEGWGYGFMNKSKRYLKDPTATPRDHHVWRRVEITKIVDNLLKRGITIRCNEMELIQSFYETCPPSIFHTYDNSVQLHNDGAEFLGMNTLGGPRREFTNSP
jgi:hypothetical protein